MHANRWHQATAWIVRVLLIALLAVVAASVAVLVILPRATHGTALTVLTGSMTPTIPVGSVVLDRPVDPGTLRVGDVATYQKAAGQAEYITHRIVAINTKTNPVTFTFKGDANRGPDVAPVPATAIRGKVWFHVAHLGTIRDSIQSRGMRATVMVFALIGLVVYAATQVLSIARDRRAARNTTKDGSTATDETAAMSLTFRADAFDGTDPQLIAHLLQGACRSIGGGRVVLTLFGSPERLSELRSVLEPFGAEDEQQLAGSAASHA